MLTVKSTEKDNTLVRDMKMRSIELQQETPHLLKILLDKKIEPYWSAFVQGSKNFGVNFTLRKSKCKPQKKKKEILTFSVNAKNKGEYMAAWGDKYNVSAIYEPLSLRFTSWKQSTEIFLMETMKNDFHLKF